VQHDDPRLQAQRHDDAVCRPQRARRQGRRPLHAAPSTPGFHQVPQRGRTRGAARPGKAIHAVLDNYATHKHPKVQRWLADHPRWLFHFTLTSASWLNAVEGFFSILTRRRLKRGAFKSVADLQEAIARYIREHNNTPKPFLWTKTANAILAKLDCLPVPSE
jgi:transposase